MIINTITTITQTKMEITRNDIIFNRIVIYRQTKNLSPNNVMDMKKRKFSK